MRKYKKNARQRRERSIRKSKTKLTLLKTPTRKLHENWLKLKRNGTRLRSFSKIMS